MEKSDELIAILKILQAHLQGDKVGLLALLKLTDIIHQLINKLD
jgi:hypothetical protein